MVSFSPNFALKNPHVQSLLASTSLRRWMLRRHGLAVESGAREVYVDCGHDVQLKGFHTTSAGSPERGLVVLLHGWEGSADSSYLLSTAEHLLEQGYDVFRLNFRDHGDTHHLNSGIFHSCRLDEVVNAVRRIYMDYRPAKLYLAGFSLGGNFALRIALRAPESNIPLAAVVAVSPAIHPKNSMHAISASPFFYARYFVRKWASSLRRKQALFPHLYNFDLDLRNHGLLELTEALVEQHTDYEGVDHYFDGYTVSGEQLMALKVPTSIVTAEDDPVVPFTDFVALTESDYVKLTITRHGGHCGFLERLSPRGWIEGFISNVFLSSARP